MKKVDELIQKTKERGHGIDDKEYWFSLEKELLDFLNDESNTKEDKRKLRQFGWTESVYIICRGIEEQV